MKRRIFLLALILLLCVLSPALANSWGLTGQMLDLVSDTNEWNDYILLGEQTDGAAVMKTRYHNVLLIAGKSGLEAYTKAVFQPGGSYSGKPTLTQNEKQLSIRYHDGLWFTFSLKGGSYRLHSAKAGDITVKATNDEFRYTVRDDHGTTAVINRSYPLSDFNIELFPRSINEVRHLNLMRDQLDSETVFSFPQAQAVRRAGEGTAPVYSSPFGKSAWRAASGKAAVGLNGTLEKLHAFRNADGQEYWCIRYNVSPRTQRIGYIDRRILDGSSAEPWPQTTRLLQTSVTVIQQTWLTDDPDVSQYAQFTLPVGAQLTCLGRWGEDYAVVSAEAKGDRLVDGGQIVWGFVPLRDLQMTAVWGTEPEATVMEQLVGSWYFAAGGISVGDVLRLNADCTYACYSDNADHLPSGEPEATGSWYVMRHNPASNLYWNEPDYEIIFLNDDGTARVEGLSLGENAFSLTNWEGGGGYQRVAP